jgi:acyl carrier protein
MKNIEKVVLDVVSDLGEEYDNDMLRSPELSTRLFSQNLDSLGTVTLIAELEERISEEYDVDLVLADERAMSQKTSPFRSVKSLIIYIDGLLKEKQEEV